MRSPPRPPDRGGSRQGQRAPAQLAEPQKAALQMYDAPACACRSPTDLAEEKAPRPMSEESTPGDFRIRLAWHTADGRFRKERKPKAGGAARRPPTIPIPRGCGQSARAARSDLQPRAGKTSSLPQVRLPLSASTRARDPSAARRRGAARAAQLAAPTDPLGFVDSSATRTRLNSPARVGVRDAVVVAEVTSRAGGGGAGGDGVPLHVAARWLGGGREEITAPPSSPPAAAPLLVFSASGGARPAGITSSR